jgi:hypothetical protein
MGRSRSGNNAFFGPLSTDPYDYGLPVTPREPPRLDPVAIWQFKHMAAVADRKRAWLVGVTATDAATKRWIAIANELDAVQHAYPNARCGIENRDTEWSGLFRRGPDSQHQRFARADGE